MKVLVLFGLCVLLVVVSALPHPDQDQDQVEEDDQQRDQRRRLQALQVRIVEDKENRGNDRREVDRDRDDEEDDEDDDDSHHHLKTPQLDVIARQLDSISKIYGGNGKLKLTYNPPQQRSLTNGYYDLGGLSFRYVPLGSSNSGMIADKYLDAGLSNISPYSTGIYHHHPQFNGYRSEQRYQQQRKGDLTRHQNYRMAVQRAESTSPTPYNFGLGK